VVVVGRSGGEAVDDDAGDIAHIQIAVGRQDRRKVFPQGHVDAITAGPGCGRPSGGKTGLADARGRRCQRCPQGGLADGVGIGADRHAVFCTNAVVIGDARSQPGDVIAAASACGQIRDDEAGKG